MQDSRYIIEYNSGKDKLLFSTNYVFQVINYFNI